MIHVLKSCTRRDSHYCEHCIERGRTAAGCGEEREGRMRVDAVDGAGCRRKSETDHVSS